MQCARLFVVLVEVGSLNVRSTQTPALRQHGDPRPRLKALVTKLDLLLKVPAHNHNVEGYESQRFACRVGLVMELLSNLFGQL